MVHPDAEKWKTPAHLKFDVRMKKLLKEILDQTEEKPIQQRMNPG